MSEPDRASRNEPEGEWFEEVVVSLLPELLAAARRLTRSPSDAEDLVAEAVARAWEHLDDLKDRERFRGWIFRILTNAFYSEKRTARARADRVPLPEDEEEPSFSLFERVHQPFLLWWGHPEQEFLDRLLREDLERAVDGLPVHYRVVVLLVDVQGFTYREAADAIDVPVGTVRSRLARGRSLLQEALWEHAVDAGLEDPEPRTGSANS